MISGKNKIKKNIQVARCTFTKRIDNKIIIKAYFLLPSKRNLSKKYFSSMKITKLIIWARIVINGDNEQRTIIVKIAENK